MGGFYSKEKVFSTWKIFPTVLLGPDGLYSWYSRPHITQQDVEVKAGSDYKEEVLMAAAFLRNFGTQQESEYKNRDGDIVTRTLSLQEIEDHQRFAYALSAYCSLDATYDNYLRVAAAVDSVNHPSDVKLGVKNLADYDTARFLAGLFLQADY